MIGKRSELGGGTASLGMGYEDELFFCLHTDLYDPE